MRLAVTGATGFVGGAVARAARALGWRVHGYGSRDWDIAVGPLADPPAVDAVVHAAAAVTDWGDGERIRRVCVDGTRHVAETFPGARLVHISTASVYDPFVPTVNAPESAGPVTRYLTDYAAAKAESERVLAGRPDTVVLRPHAVYGPGDPTLLPRVLGAIRGRNLVIVGDGQAPQSLTSIDNLVAATLSACTGRPGVYNIADAHPVVLQDALRDLLRERGSDVRIRHLPLRAAWHAAGVAEWVWRLVGAADPPRLTRYAISHLGYERTLDITAAREGLGYSPTGTSFAGAADW
ncbi:NAD-dependent epimerase/dehydratase family protein [Actinosynnema sp. NPDC047251]|uniref:NAD-dependent epimerase/dehydratase n=1 Tax=Saccharothrix espanaensis (strain ATCC 51144 / DSM 44229 / JCM 9112 / NBRC 15066 / NRRL 15764) TaxID=1179773 RepID=K0JTL8_SACES|nr:NAD-dependent epimerase/dehydratase family protein [Saccharothrix espanaensis]CCH31120.1 NAD-dependent epimerase/dehydratase [Saccharothrix espanaensis DSM 44229]